jgi:predicted MFS family arabinose efflux permease
VSYLVSVVTLSFIRTTFRREPTRAERTRLLADMRTGARWFWGQPFIRTTSLLVMGSDFTLNALYLVVIVIAQQRGASSALIGAMFVFLGVGGLLGATVASRIARRFRMREIVVATQCAVATLLPLLIVVPGEITPGVIYGAMFFLHPAWNATVGAYRLQLAPDDMQGRVSSLATLFSLGPVPLASLAAGFLLEGAGSTPAVLLLSGVMIAVAMAAILSRAIKDAPERLAASPVVHDPGHAPSGS